MTEGSLLSYNAYWRASLLAGLALILAYIYFNLDVTPSGGTFIGLIYGAIGLVVIFLLFFLGARKRWYTSHIGTVQGWTSAHIYLGLLVLLIIPMHAGFHFGWNIHTLAFVFLVVTVLSGMVGVILYLLIPRWLTISESGMLPDTIESEINRLLSEMEVLASGKFGAFRGFYLGEMQRARPTKLMGWRILFQSLDRTSVLAARTHEFSKFVSKIPKSDQEDYSQFFGLVLKKAEIENDLARQMRLKNALEVWLFVHVPASIALLVTVVIHVIVVLIY